MVSSLIRKAVSGDYQLLSKYYKEFDENGVDLFEGNPFANVLVYEKDRNIVGFISYSIIYERAEIDYIYVESSYRGQNIAGELMEFCIEEAKSNGCKNITLEVNNNNIEQDRSI
jgi:ribosomal protein S18 acetylase RimI-like enzyme